MNATIQAKISGKYDLNKLCFTMVFGKSETKCVNISTLIGVIPLHDELSYGEKYEFYILTTGCKNSCSAKSNTTNFEICRAKLKKIF